MIEDKDKKSGVAIGGISDEEIKRYAEKYHTFPHYIISLIKGGVKPEDIEDILEIRDSMLYNVDFITDIRREKTFAIRKDYASFSSILKAYNLAGKDLDIFRKIIDLSLRKKVDFEESMTRGIYTKALLWTVNKISALIKKGMSLDSAIDYLEEKLEEDLEE